MGESSENLSTYVPVYDFLPDTWEEGRQALLDYLREIANGINVRDVGGYYKTETLTGQNFVPSISNDQQRAVFRKVIDIGGLIDFSVGAPATKSVAHGVSINANTHFTKIYGTATNPSTAFIPLPFVSSVSVGECIELSLDATNVNLISSFDYSGFTKAFVVLEYTQES